MNAIDIFPWDENFCTGLTEIDNQHRRLVELLNRLASHVAFSPDPVALNAIFDELTEYTVYHFSTEEEIWHQYLADDPLETSHQATHRHFVDTVRQLRTSQGDRSLDEIAEEVLGFLARWLASHILETDRYMAYVTRALQAGLDSTQARQQAAEQMSGSTRVLIDLILSIYDSLSANTLRLMRELAERKRREEALVQARIQAEAASMAKSRFLATMSHEIRTPLNAILGMGYLLRDEELDRDERQEFAGTIVDSGNQLLKLLTNILNLAQTETGQQDIAARPFRPAHLLEQVLSEFSPACQQKGLALLIEDGFAADSRYVGDADHVHTMLTNLLSNAVKFTTAGRITLNGHAIPGTESDPVLEFSVSDTGCGIAPEQQARLFQAFQPLDDSTTRRHDGAGLGLSVVRALALLMGGDAGVDSTPGNGSRFWFRVKVGTAQPAA